MSEGRRVSDANKAIMQRFYDEVVNAGNVDLIDELLSDDFTEHEELPGVAPGREGVKQFFRMFKQAFPDGTMTAEHVVAEGDTVAARVTVRGTHQGEFMGIPATGKKVTVGYMDMWRLDGGKAVENWVRLDMLGLMQQLGAVPSP